MATTALQTQHLEAWMRRSATHIAARQTDLTDLDAAIGDADHGTNLARGFRTVCDKLAAEPQDTPAGLLRLTAMTLMSAVGGASGMLYGTFFLKAANAAIGHAELSAETFETLMWAGIEGIRQRGRAERGDKTMLDAWLPAHAALRDALQDGRSLAEALQAACLAAEQGRQATIPLQARKGRASYLGERSVGHADPGATSTGLLLCALAQTLQVQAEPPTE